MFKAWILTLCASLLLCLGVYIVVSVLVPTSAVGIVLIAVYTAILIGMFVYAVRFLR